jgi:hypothetical protein
LRSLGIEPHSDNELNDKEEIQDVADTVMLSIYQDYDTAYGKNRDKFKEAESTLG